MRYGAVPERSVRCVAVGLAFLGHLARQRSLASAALFFLVLVDEIEALVFLAVGIVLHRIDLFLAAQDVLLPAVLFVAGAATLARSWRRVDQAEPVLPVEPMELAALTERTSALAPSVAGPAPAGPGAAISLSGLSRGRTSRPGSR